MTVRVRNADPRLRQKANIELDVIADKECVRRIEETFQLLTMRENGVTARDHRRRYAIDALGIRPLCLTRRRIHTVDHRLTHAIHNSEGQYFIITAKAGRLRIKD